MCALKSNGLIFYLLSVAVSCLLVGCGGGGSGGGAGTGGQSSGQATVDAPVQDGKGAVTDGPPKQDDGPSVEDDKTVVTAFLPTIVPSQATKKYNMYDAQRGLSISFDIQNVVNHKTYITHAPSNPVVPDSNIMSTNGGEVFTIYGTETFHVRVESEDGTQFKDEVFTFAFDMDVLTPPLILNGLDKIIFKDLVQMNVVNTSAKAASIYYGYANDLGIQDDVDFNEKVASGSIHPFQGAFDIACPEPSAGLIDGGSIYIQAVSVTDLGNISSVSNAVELICDRTEAQVTLNAPDPGAYDNSVNSISVRLSANEPVYFRYTKKNGADLSNKDDPDVVEVFKVASDYLDVVLDQAYNYFNVIAIDEAGNVTQGGLERVYTLLKNDFVEFYDVSPNRTQFEDGELISSIRLRKSVVNPLAVYATVEDRSLDCSNPSEDDRVMFDGTSDLSNNILPDPIAGITGETYTLKYCFVLYTYESSTNEERTFSFVAPAILTSPQDSFIADDVVEVVPIVSYSVNAPIGIDFITYDNHAGANGLAQPSNGATDFSSFFNWPVDSGNNLTLKVHLKSGRIEEKIFSKMGGARVLSSVVGQPFRFRTPIALAVDEGNQILYIADRNEAPAMPMWAEQARILKLDLQTGSYERIAGSDALNPLNTMNNALGLNAFDGQDAKNATLMPRGLAVDSQGDLYISDIYSRSIKKVDRTTGLLSTVAGNGTSFGVAFVLTSVGMSVDANTIGMVPTQLVFDDSDNLYVADAATHRILMISDLNSIPMVSMIAPLGANSLNTPTGVAVDATGNVFMADSARHLVKWIHHSRTQMSILAGKIPLPGSSIFIGSTALKLPVGQRQYHSWTGQSDDGPALNAQFGFRRPAIAEVNGSLYVTDENHNSIRKISNIYTDPVVSTVANLYSTLGIGRPTHIVADSTGNVYVANSGGAGREQILKIDSNNADALSLLAQGGAHAGLKGDGEQATEALLNHPSSLFVSSNGDMFIADFSNYTIRKIEASSGEISSYLVGSPEATFAIPMRTQDQAAIILNKPKRIIGDANGTLYVVSRFRYREAGTLNEHKADALLQFVPGQTSGSLLLVSDEKIVDIDMDQNHRLYILKKESSGSYSLLHMEPSGVLTAVLSGLSYVDPTRIAVSDGHLYVVDRGGDSIIKQDLNNPTSAAVVIAGTGSAIAVSGPSGIALDGVGNVFLADQNNHRILRLSRSGELIVLLNSTDGIRKPRDLFIKNSDLYIVQGDQILKFMIQ